MKRNQSSKNGAGLVPMVHNSVSISDATSAALAPLVASILEEENALHTRFQKKLSVNHDLDRTLVSFQANKQETGYRWYKYKEAFSASLVRYLIDKLKIGGRLLDPFAGSGNALFIASEIGLDSVGIELLPSSAAIIEARRWLAQCDRAKTVKELRHLIRERKWTQDGKQTPFAHLSITAGAFPPETERLLCRYLWQCENHKNKELRPVLRFAAMCVLESISYTRKDGQYLRWDSRSGRGYTSKDFNKGPILEFTPAIVAKLEEIILDLEGDDSLFPETVSNGTGTIELMQGSTLDILPKLDAESFGAIITSPPYCNRYDYTRTYALELAMLGVDKDAIRSLRQTMLSCTVENLSKTDLAEKSNRATFEGSQRAFRGQSLLNGILKYLEQCRTVGVLNNNGIPRMVQGYFEEMALTIFESFRALKPGAYFVMVNDNVRYQGVHVPVDLILSDFAELAGFTIESIWVLPKGKGNSSQQMGSHGRREVRKGVYVWKKPKAR